MFQKLKKYDIAYYCILLGLSLILGGLISVILMIPIVLIFQEPFLNSPLFTLTTLFSTALSALLIIIFATRKKAATLRDLGLKKENFIKNYPIGLLVGFITISLSLLITYVFGGAKYLGVVIDKPILLLFFFLGFLIQGFEEELLCRGFMMNGLSKTRSILFAVIFNSLFFAALHLGNDGLGVLPLFNLFLAGLSFSMMAIYFDDIWVASGAHSMWNFAQGNFYGFLVSGTDMGPSVFRFELTGSNFISGGAFGLEGGIGVLIVETLTIIIFYLLYKKKQQKQKQES